jgi:hypothetical protein
MSVSAEQHRVTTGLHATKHLKSIRLKVRGLWRGRTSKRKDRGRKCTFHVIFMLGFIMMMASSLTNPPDPAVPLLLLRGGDVERCPGPPTLGGDLPPAPGVGWTVVRDEKDPMKIVYITPPLPISERRVKIDKASRLDTYITKGVFPVTVKAGMIFCMKKWEGTNILSSKSYKNYFF